MRGVLSGASIRARLVVGMVVLVSAGLAAANATGILLLRSYLLDRVDEQVGAIGPAGADARPLSPPDGLCTNPRDPQGLRSDFLLLVIDDDGQVSCSLGPELGANGPDLDTAHLGSSDGTMTVPSQNGDTDWRVRTVHNAESGQTLVLAVSLADAEATVSRLTRLSLLVSGLVLVLTAGGGWLIARIGLQPLERIEDTAERIATGDLSERVPAFRRRTEVGRLSHSLNGMLAQIERAFAAQAASETKLRRFVSDASHELRTPVAAIRGHAEMWRTGITDDLDTVISRIESESRRMGDLVDDMLLLARLDQSRPLEQEPVDLLSLATDAVVDAQALQPDRPISLVAHPGQTAPTVIGDEPRLRQILANLMTNALAHTPATSPVTVTVRADPEHVTVEVSDHGPGMTPEVAARVFDRFYRADPGRTRDHGGTGLGLAIVKSLTEAHGGKVTCRSSVSTGSTFVITLPLATATRARFSRRPPGPPPKTTNGPTFP